MSTCPDWVLSLSDADLERRFGHETLRRGRDYADQQRVTSIRVAGQLVMASVRGSGYLIYQTSVVAQAGPASLVASCTCPVRHDCKHACALIVHLRRVQRRRVTPGWQQALDPLVVRAPGARGGTALALQVDDGPYGITLRPLKQGARGWVKSGASWDDLRFHAASGFDEAQREVLVALLESRRRNDFTYGHRVDALPLTELRPDVWALLAKAAEVGVTLLGGEDRARRRQPDPVLASEPFDPRIHVTPAGDGVDVTPVVNVGDEYGALTSVSFLGRPPHGLSAHLPDGRLLLGRLTRPLDQSEARLFESGSLSVPASDVPLFATGFLPQLSRRLTVRVDASLALPEASPPLLLCRVTFAERRATLEWGFRYPLGPVNHDVGLRGRASDPPIRDAEAEAALASSVPEGPWRLGDDRPELQEATLIGRALIEFVGEVLPRLSERDDVEVTLNEPPPEFSEAEDAPRVELKVADSDVGDWFDLGVEVWVGDERVPFGPLFRALAMEEDHLILDTGTWFDLDRPELDHLRVLIEEARALVDHEGDDTFHLRPEHAGLWEELVSLGVVNEQSAAWREAVSALLDTQALPEVDAPAGLRADLRPYQLTGFRWLSLLWRTRLGGILADEMGLGKTLQALALAQAAHEAGELTEPMLVVAPTSVIGTWASEAAKFAPDLRVVAVTETERRRGVPLAEAVDGAQVVVTSYTLLRLEADAYAALGWSAVMLDEAQFVKNHASQAYKAVRRLRARVKVALTGTPLENNLMDLWSLLSITAPGLFVDPRTFTETYRRPIEGGDREVLARLHRRIRPLILRRTKAAVATELPEKQEQVLPIELSAAHRKLYDKHLARERQKVLGLVGDLSRNRITILRSLTLLRQLSLAPSLIDGSYPEASAKTDALVERLAEVISEGHRALVFSQFTGFLALVRKRLDAEGVGYEYLDGRTRDRAARIRSFREGDAPVFLISLKAGGFGLTLTEADYVFILDPWWNPAAESQAVDRTHRIGQDKPVNVYRLVSADTIEEKVVALQETKRHLFDQVVGQASDMAAPLSADDIRGLLEA